MTTLDLADFDDAKRDDAYRGLPHRRRGERDIFTGTKVVVHDADAPIDRATWLRETAAVLRALHAPVAGDDEQQPPTGRTSDEVREALLELEPEELDAAIEVSIARRRETAAEGGRRRRAEVIEEQARQKPLEFDQQRREWLALLADVDKALAQQRAAQTLDLTVTTRANAAHVDVVHRVLPRLDARRAELERIRIHVTEETIS